MEQKCGTNNCNLSNGAGKGDKPRSCFSKNFKNNYEEINWEDKSKGKLNIKKKNKTKYVY